MFDEYEYRYRAIGCAGRVAMKEDAVECQSACTKWCYEIPISSISPHATRVETITRVFWTCLLTAGAAGYFGIWAIIQRAAYFLNLSGGIALLVSSPSTRRRDQLRKAFAEKNANKPVAKLYRFASTHDLTPEAFLTQPIFYCCHQDDPVPLVKKLTDSQE